MTTRPIVLIGTISGLLMLPRQVLAAPTVLRATASTAPQFVLGEVLVKFKPEFTAQDRQLAVASYGHSILAELIQPGWAQIKVQAGRTVGEAITAYRNDPRVEYAQPNYIYHAAAAPNDPQYGQLWAFKNSGQTISNAFTQPPGTPIGYSVNNPGTPGDDIDIEKAWDQMTDCSSVVVAVIDSGVNYNQEDLAGNMWNGGTTFPLHGFNFVNHTNDPMDLDGHGTHVAGIIGAVGNNAKGTTGVCWKANIMAVRVLDATGHGTTATFVQGVTFAVANGARVINMSFGGSAASFPQAESDAITNAQNNGVVVVVAAGNNGANNDSGSTPVYPCNFTQPNLVCVAALDQSYQLATFSNYGSTSVDVGAPGTNILSTWAGTNATVADPLTSGWFGSTTTTGGGWFFSTIGSTQFLVDPSSYPNGLYNKNTDDRAFKSFNLAGVSAAVLTFFTAINVVSGDHFRVGYASTAVDPFAGTGTIGDDFTNVATYPKFIPVTEDISSCISANCTVGFQLRSGTNPTDRGVAIAGFSIDTLALNSTSYNTINGTSMATPEVAGLATMLRAYNPQYTYADVVSAIEVAGRPVASLAGKTTTGNAIDVMSSLAYIHPPTGLTAAVQ